MSAERLIEIARKWAKHARKIGPGITYHDAGWVEFYMGKKGFQAITFRADTFNRKIMIRLHEPPIIEGSANAIESMAEITEEAEARLSQLEASQKAKSKKDRDDEKQDTIRALKAQLVALGEPDEEDITEGRQ